MDFDTGYALFISGVAIGALLMKWSEGARWRRNADVVQRIESRGKLYKVVRAEVYDEMV